MRPLRAGFSAAIAIAAAFGVTECTIWDGLVLPAPDAGGAGTGSSQLDTCDHARLPSAPSGTDIAGGIAFTTVMRSLDFGSAGTVGDAAVEAGAADGGDLVGYDLDGVCTCVDAAPPSCARRAGNVCDDTHGRDNGATALVRSIAERAFFDLAEKADENITKGRLNMVFFVEDYNGHPDDSNVYLTLLVSRGLYGSDGGLLMPKFTASERWSIDPTQVTGTDSGTGTKVLYTGRFPGFVKDHQLVVEFDTSRKFLLGGIEIALEGVKVTAQIAGDGDGDGGFTLTSGIVAGRWPASPALTALRGLEFGGGVPPLCQIGLFQTVKDEFCAGLDIATEPGNDGKGLPCDALSTAIHFVGAPGGIGAPLSDKPGADCPPAEAGELVCPQ